MYERPGGDQPIEQADVIPTAYSQPNEKFFQSAYGPMIAPYGPAFESPWRNCPPEGGRLQDLSMGGESWNKFPHAERVLPLPNDFEIVNIGRCHPNEYLGYARSGGMYGQIAKSRSDGSHAASRKEYGGGGPIYRTLRGSAI